MLVVTGGGGFLGSNIIAELESRGIGPIVVCDELGADTKWRNLAKHTIHRFIRPDELGKFLRFRGQEVTGIICMGANSSTSETDAQALIDANIEPFRGIWNACCRLQIPLIYASSASVYGLDANGVDDDRPEAIRALRPLNAYGWSKKVCDEYAAAPPQKWSLAPPSWYGLRFFNVYGCNEGHKADQRSYVSKVLEAGQKGTPIKLFPGDFARDWVYALDVSKLVVSMIEMASSPDAKSLSGIYNVGSGEARGFGEIIDLVRDLGMRVDVDRVEMPEAMRAGYQPRTKANITKLQTAFPDFKPMPLEDGIAHYAFAFTGGGWDAYR